MRKAWEETQQKEAFKDLLLIRGANGGTLKFKDMKDLVEKYKKKVIPRSQEIIYIIGCDAIKLLK